MIRNFKRAWEMYAFLIGTIIGLLIIGAMFFGYGIYKSGTSNSVSYTALANQDVSKLSSTRVNNSIEFDTTNYLYAKTLSDLTAPATDYLSTLTAGKATVFVVDSQKTSAGVSILTSTGYLAISNDDVVTGFVVKWGTTDTVRVPKYFKAPTGVTTASASWVLLQAN